MSNAKDNIVSSTQNSSTRFPKDKSETRNPKPGTVLLAYMRLARPANIVTAWADVLAGAAVAGASAAFFTMIDWAPGFEPESLTVTTEHVLWLVLATTGLYGGGVVFNDVFDADLDAVERPERPIPSGQASLSGAVVFGLLLLVVGILAAWQVSWKSGVLAAGIALAAVLYDKFSKHHTFWGPVNMGMCRAMNLLLGISVIPETLMAIGPYYLALLPLLYIGAITLISQGEVHGGTSTKGWLAVGFLGIVITMLGFVAADRYYADQFYQLFFPVLFVLLVAPPFIRAARKPDAPTIRKAVKAGILGLIPMNAAIASNYTSWEFCLLILLLLPISIGLGRLFALT